MCSLITVAQPQGTSLNLRQEVHCSSSCSILTREKLMWNHSMWTPDIHTHMHICSTLGLKCHFLYLHCVIEAMRGQKYSHCSAPEQNTLQRQSAKSKDEELYQDIIEIMDYTWIWRCHSALLPFLDTSPTLSIIHFWSMVVSEKRGDAPSSGVCRIEA